MSEALTDADPEVRILAAFGARLVDNPLMIARLTAALSDRDPHMRAMSALSLARSRQRAALAAPVILKRIPNEQEDVQQAFLAALALIAPNQDQNDKEVLVQPIRGTAESRRWAAGETDHAAP